MDNQNNNLLKMKCFDFFLLVTSESKHFMEFAGADLASSPSNVFLTKDQFDNEKCTPSTRAF